MRYTLLVPIGRLLLECPSGEELDVYTGMSSELVSCKYTNSCHLLNENLEPC